MQASRFIHYKLDDGKIDRQHLTIFTAANIIVQKLKNKESVSLDIIIFGDLLKYHFKDEITSMEVDSYPYVEYHKTLHRDLLLTLEEMKLYESCTYYWLPDFVQTFVDHVDGPDRNYFNWLKENVKV